MPPTERPSILPDERRRAAVESDRESLRAGRTWLVALGLLPALVYAILAFRYAIDFPYWDDDIEFLRACPDGRDPIAWLARSHNEHRLFVPHVVAELQCSLEGYVNFRHLAWIGGLFLAAFWACLVASFRGLRASRWHIAATGALVFAPAAWPTVTWTTSALQNNGVLLLSFCSLALFRHAGPWAIAASLVVAALATFTSASGLLIFPVLAVWTLARIVHARADGDGRARREVVVLVLVLATAVATSLVFFDGHPHPKHRIDVGAALSAPWQGALRTLGVLGSALSFQGPGSPPLIGLALSVGGAIVVLFLLAAASGRLRDRPLLVAWSTFLALSAASIGAGRIDEGLEQAIAARYATLSIAALVATYLIWMADEARPVRGRRALAGLVLALAFWIVSVVAHAPKLAERHARVATARAEWPEIGDAFRSITRRDRAFPMIAAAVHMGRFALPYLPPAQATIPVLEGDGWVVDPALTPETRYQGNRVLLVRPGPGEVEITCVAPREAQGARRLTLLVASDGAFEFRVEIGDRSLGTASAGSTSRVMRDLVFDLDPPLAEDEVGRPIRIVRVGAELPVLVEAVRFLE